ncbi:MAG: hypothetical protein P9L94_11505 [Candidatus Hinthialibacter antarcticus]|nr:hypothetical protein [Candidatus Hinthialibacter antarcticus]
MTRTVDNNGIGALYATFAIHETTPGTYDLDSDDVGKAVGLEDSYEVGFGSDGDRILGRLEHVAGGLATVQIAGVARFIINTAKTAPGVGDSLVVDGAGKVYQAPAIDGATGDPAGGNIARGVTLSADANACDALL